MPYARSCRAKSRHVIERPSPGRQLFQPSCYRRGVGRKPLRRGQCNSRRADGPNSALITMEEAGALHEVERRTARGETRQEEGRGGKEWVSTCGVRWSQDP